MAWGWAPGWPGMRRGLFDIIKSSADLIDRGPERQRRVRDRLKFPASVIIVSLLHFSGYCVSAPAAGAWPESGGEGPERQGVPLHLDYTVSPVFDGDSLTALRVDLVFQGNRDGVTRLALPDRWGGEQALWKAVEDLHAEGAGVSVEPVTATDGAATDDHGGAGERILRHGSGADIHLRYRLVQDFDGPQRAGANTRYRVTIQPDHFHVIGWTAFAYPLRGMDTQVPVTVRFTGFPRTWAVASDLTHGGLTLRALRQSISVGGDFPMVTMPLGESRLRVALLGRQSVDDVTFARTLRNIMNANLSFWQDEAEPYLVTVLPLVPERRRSLVAGTGLGDAFAFFMTPKVPLPIVERTLAHEHLHSWIPGALGGARTGDGPETDERRDFWFSEGFTVFYTWRIGVRFGRIGVSEAIRELNEILERYGRSPYRDAPNDEVMGLFYTDRDANRLPYDRGMLIALLWDRIIHRETGGKYTLDDVMLALKETHEGHYAPAATDRLLGEIKRVTGVDLQSSYQRHVVEGRPVVLPEDILSACGTVQTGGDGPAEVQRFEAHPDAVTNAVTNAGRGRAGQCRKAIAGAAR